LRRLKVPVRGTSKINRVDMVVRDLSQLKNPKYSEDHPELIMSRLIFENFGGGPVCYQKLPANLTESYTGDRLQLRKSRSENNSSKPRDSRI